ncbi:MULTISPECIES: hypothetical protein [Elizabethkingia]|nr:hypothetical protein [Elizabethkingia meningoseptica]
MDCTGVHSHTVSGSNTMQKGLCLISLRHE